MIFTVLCCLLKMALAVYQGIHAKMAVNVMFITFATCVCCWVRFANLFCFCVVCIRSVRCSECCRQSLECHFRFL